MREVRHYYFQSWPDHGVPKYPTQLLAFRRHFRTHHLEQSGPIIVHCRYDSFWLVKEVPIVQPKPVSVVMKTFRCKQYLDTLLYASKKIYSSFL